MTHPVLVGLGEVVEQRRVHLAIALALVREAVEEGGRERGVHGGDHVGSGRLRQVDQAAQDVTLGVSTLGVVTAPRGVKHGAEARANGVAELVVATGGLKVACQYKNHRSVASTFRLIGSLMAPWKDSHELARGLHLLAGVVAAAPASTATQTPMQGLSTRYVGRQPLKMPIWT